MKQLFLVYFLTVLLLAEHNYTNALINEDSPYLRQHAHNPVDWYPWGKEAFEKAKKENKLIFLSIGYSTCHWCHVMEEESFEDEEVARLLNQDYISIKVDREQFPQIDKKYQQLFKSLNGRSGGWPLSVFLTPEQKLLYVTTYIPKEKGYGSDGMFKLLPHYSRLFQQNSKKLEQLTSAYDKATKKGFSTQREVVNFDQQLIESVVKTLEENYDAEYGGFGERPKFPEASKISLLLDIYRINGNPKVLSMAKESLTKMARSGLYDQVDGGFFRYTTDQKWQMPHFEKMLYSNAQLISLYARLYQLDPDPLYLKVVNETIAEMDRRFLHQGLYFSASDADSDGEEGGYFIYEYTEIVKGLKERGLNDKDIDATLAYLGIEEDGNIDGDLSHLHLDTSRSPKETERVKAYLRELRQSRTFPFVDKKIITAWNAMMIQALFAAGRIDARYIEEGRARIKSLLSKMSKRELLYHQTLADKQPQQEGLLEDYAFVVDALIKAHQVTLDAEYLHLADRFAEKAIALFYRQGKWYLSNDGVEVLADSDDKHYTAPLTMMLSGLAALAVLKEDLKMDEIVSETLENYGRVLRSNSASAPKLMSVFLRHKIGEIVLKSKQDNLMENQREIEAIDYPFVLIKAQDTPGYLACKLGTCFAESEQLKPVVLKIEAEKNLIGIQKTKQWK